ncbi:MAG: hypothetical protein ACLFSA_07450, partial [Spirochaetaceae bacterium]
PRWGLMCLKIIQTTDIWGWSRASLACKLYYMVIVYNYLRLSAVPVGYLVNFAGQRVVWKRFVV